MRPLGDRLFDEPAYLRRPAATSTSSLPSHGRTACCVGLSRWQVRRLRQRKARARDLARLAALTGPPGVFIPTARSREASSLFLPPASPAASRPPSGLPQAMPGPGPPKNWLESLEAYVGRRLERLENMLRFLVLNQEPGRSSQMSAGVVTGVDSLAAPSGSSAAPKGFAQRHRARWASGLLCAAF